MNNSSKIYHFTPSVSLLNISVQKIIDRIGYSTSAIPDIFKYELEENIMILQEVLKPSCGYVKVNQIESIASKGQLLLGDVIFNTNKIISHPLRNISEAILFVGTVGEEYDSWTKSKKVENDPLSEYILDVLGSEIAEAISTWIYEKIKVDMSKKGRSVTNRYSPGYCGWNVEEQSKLFSFFPPKFCDISLTDSSLMMPMKSVSGLVGLGENIEFQDYPCDVCNAKHCHKNRRGILV